MKDHKNLLVFERKPTPSGNKKWAPTQAVGGELLPLNLARLTVANLIWILLLILPIVLLYVLAKRGVRVPTPVRRLIRFIPFLGRSILG
jgi:hypothetical protein